MVEQKETKEEIDHKLNISDLDDMVPEPESSEHESMDDEGFAFNE